MHKRFVILAAVSSALVCGVIAQQLSAQVQDTHPAAPAAQPAADQADIPIKQVVLFSSGVGYFEHFGSIKGDSSAELRFKTAQINDVLKSLLLQDMDGGRIGTVSYSGQAPLAFTLKSFQVDITANPNMGELLNQLRGAKIILTVGDKPLTGVILGVEQKPTATGDKGAVVEIPILNLKSGHDFRSIPLSEIRSMALDDPKLEKELDEALDALSQSRDQDKKPMTIHFRGVGERRVRIGYVVETPVWKTSYRLVLNSGDIKAAAGEVVPPGVKEPIPAPAATQPAAHDDAKLQGWAIVENQTDNDWNDVQLSLVSGRPLSFIQDLYHAMYIPRPVVQPQLFASLQPQTYAGGMSIRDLTTNIPDFTDAPDFSLNSTSNKQQPQGGGGIGAGGGGDAGGRMKSGGGGGGSLFGGGGGEMKDAAPAQPIDPTASIISAASAAKVGELFQYTVGSVSLGRQKSAMIPIITDDIDAERISIYNEAALADHPLLGARIKNNTKKFLLQGPITVLDHNSYAGDARIDDLPPGQERLISYGIDQQVLVDANVAKQTSGVLTGSLVKGVLHLTSKDVMEQTYVVDNKSDDARTLVLEHPRQGDWTLTSPKVAEETTADLFRFQRKVEPHKSFKMTVTKEMLVFNLVELGGVSPDDLAHYIKIGTIPQKVRDAIAKAIQMRADVLAINQEIEKRHIVITGITSDQARIREDMKSVSADTDYYKRMVKKLDDQETLIEKTEKEIAEERKASDALQRQLNEYLATLTVE